MATTSTWSSKYARGPDGQPLNMEQVLQGVVSSDQQSLRTALVGVDGNGVLRPVLVDTDGKLDVGLSFSGDVTLGTLTIDQATPGTTNGVVVNSSALPTGAATQTTLASILTNLADPATQTTLAALNAKVTAVNTGAVVISSSALPTGAATQTTLATLDGKVTACNTGAVVVSSSALPSGAATAAKQPALGTAGTASADVISVQGIASGTALAISGTVTANTATMTLASSTAYEASRVVKASAGTLFALTGYNSGPAQFIQLFNSTTVPANGTAPILLIAVPAQSTFAFEWTKGLPCGTGIAISNSSTGATKTIGSADCFFTASYV